MGRVEELALRIGDVTDCAMVADGMILRAIEHADRISADDVGFVSPVTNRQLGVTTWWQSRRVSVYSFALILFFVLCYVRERY